MQISYIETNILHGLHTNQEFFSTIYNFIEPNLHTFQNPFVKMILTESVEVQKKITTRPCWDDLIMSLENNMNLSEEEVETCITLIQETRVLSVEVNTKSLLDSSLVYIKNNRTLELLQIGADIISGNETKKSLESIQEEMKQITSLSFEKKLGMMLDDKDRFWSYEKSKKSTGIDWLDNFLGGGLPPKTLTMFYAMPHAGKSQLKLFIAASLISAGIDVCFVTLEMPTEMCMQRIDSILFQIESWKICSSKMSFKDYSDMLDLSLQTTNGKLNVIEFPSGCMTANDLEKHLIDCKNDLGMNTGAVLIDSINLARPIDNRIPQTQTDIYMEQIVKEHRAVAFRQNLAIISSIHLNREAEKEIFNGSDICAYHASKFYQMYGYADFIAGLKKMVIKDNCVYKDIKCEKEIDENITMQPNIWSYVIKLNTIKTRYGGCSSVGREIYLGSNQQKSSFYLPEIKDVEGKIVSQFWDEYKGTTAVVVKDGIEVGLIEESKEVINNKEEDKKYYRKKGINFKKNTNVELI